MILKELRNVRPLVPGSIRGWLSLAVVGSVVMAGLDMLGVAAMLPLMQVLTAGGPADGVTRWIADFLGTTDLQTLVIAIAGLVAVAFIVKSGFTVIFRWWLLGHTTKMTAEASAELLRRYTLAPYANHRMRKTPEVYRNIGASVPQAFNLVALGILSLVADLLTLAALAIVLFIVSPVATLVAALILTISTLLVQALSKRAILRAGQEMIEADLVAWSALIPGIDGFKEARLSSSSAMFVERFRQAKLKIALGQRKTSLLAELPKHLLEISMILAVIGMTVFLFATGPASVALATLGVFAAASLRMLPTLNRVTATVASIRAGSVGLHLLSEIVDELNAGGMHEERKTSTLSYRGDILIEDVRYQYIDADAPVLNGLTLTIKEGSTTALVGSSGAGKSTILDLLLGLQFPQSGDVTVGGRSIMEDLAGWYETIGVVPQDVFVLNLSLRENIAYGLPPEEIDDVRVRSALADARLGHIVEDLPQGLDTLLGERGVRLSGGQRQRLGIARALYRRPTVLILDEATSALDNATEQEITRTIDALRSSMTVVIVAHRLSTIKSADKIVYLEGGQVRSEGNFQELRERNADFDHLVRIGELA